MSETLGAIRSWMAQEKIDVLLLSSNDEFHNEYPPAYEEWLRWLTGYADVWGFAVITAQDSMLFVPSKGFSSADANVDQSVWTLCDLETMKPLQWVKNNLQTDHVVALEAIRFTVHELEQWQKTVKQRQGILRELKVDLAGMFWTDRPAPGRAPAEIHPLSYAGQSHTAKLDKFVEFLNKEELDGYLVTDPGHICWLLNIRGRDIADVHAFTPLLLCRAFISTDGQVLLFVDPAKITTEITDYLGPSVRICKPDTLVTAILDHNAKMIGLDPHHCPSIFAHALEAAGKDIIHRQCPIELWRALKNDTEIAGARAAHKRDAVAVIETLFWLDQHSDPTQLDEFDVYNHLKNSRSQQDLYVDDSFSAITGSGPHGAIIHYYVTPESNIKLVNDSLLLIDSGGQYRDGTTDITRTIAIGTPSAAMIADYTAVMQGHIRLDLARFPVGTGGAALDTLARGALWAHGRNYAHGTGHGVGSYGGVHEGPQRISPTFNTHLRTGMFITNEPGYYKTGAYGIRLENILLIVEKPQPGDEQQMLGFDSFTRVHFESGLIDFHVLSTAEKHWLRDYHRLVLDDIGPLLRPEVGDWLKTKCAPFLTL